MKALIFMKGNSERIPKKNLKILGNRPLCHWILEVCENVKDIDEVIINTDCNDIIKSCESFPKVKVQKRSKKLEKIQANEANALIDEMIASHYSENYINLHSTSPLLSSDTLIRAIKAYGKKKYDSMFSVTEYKSRFYKNNNDPINHNPNELIKTQFLESVFEENSAFYIFSRKFFKDNMQRITDKSKMYVTSKIESHDIDYPEDWLIAEKLINQK